MPSVLIRDSFQILWRRFGLVAAKRPSSRVALNQTLRSLAAASLIRSSRSSLVFCEVGTCEVALQTKTATTRADRLSDFLIAMCNTNGIGCQTFNKLYCS